MLMKFIRVFGFAWLIILGVIPAASAGKGDRPRNAVKIGQVLSDIERSTGGNSRYRASPNAERAGGEGNYDLWTVLVKRNLTDNTLNQEYFKRHPEIRQSIVGQILVTVPKGTERDQVWSEGWVNGSQIQTLKQELRVAPEDLEELENIKLQLQEKRAAWDIYGINLDDLPEEVVEEMRPDIEQSGTLDKSELAQLISDLSIMDPEEAEAIVDAEIGVVGLNVEPGARDELEDLDDLIIIGRNVVKAEIDKIEEEQRKVEEQRKKEEEQRKFESGSEKDSDGDR